MRSSSWGTVRLALLAGVGTLSVQQGVLSAMAVAASGRWLEAWVMAVGWLIAGAALVLWSLTPPDE